MKGTWLAFLSLAVASFAQSSQDSFSVESGKMTDPRDHQEYKVVEIGGTTWMAENLNYEVEESWCYTRFGYECRKYGRFYNWELAKTVCPEGWHLPSSEEFEKLFTDVGGKESAGLKLKSAEGWSHYGNGSDEYGFNGTPSGFRDYRGRFDRQTMYAYLWSSTEVPSAETSAGTAAASGNAAAKAVGIHLMAGRKDASIYPYSKDFGLSVRCVKNSAEE